MARLFIVVQKKKKDRARAYNLERQIPDAPTLEEFECLLGESPTNYPRVEGVEDMESQLHSAAIDMNEAYDKESYEANISYETEEVKLAFVYERFKISKRFRDLLRQKLNGSKNNFIESHC